MLEILKIIGTIISYIIGAGFLYVFIPYELAKDGWRRYAFVEEFVDWSLDRLRKWIQAQKSKQKELAMKKVTIYTDGACSGNPGPGGWGAILRYGTREKELSGGEAQTTNNRMELLGVISALQALKEPCEVDLYSDSQYICNAINDHWLDGWKKAGWKRKGGELKNPDLWQTLDELLHIHKVTFHWVKGHADNEYNNRCDALAVRQRDLHA